MRASLTNAFLLGVVSGLVEAVFSSHVATAVLVGILLTDEDEKAQKVWNDAQPALKANSLSTTGKL